jgi:hypothetical protein
MSRKIFGVEWPQKCPSNADLDTVSSAHIAPREMSKRVPFRKSDLGRAIEVAQARGWNSVQLKIGPDGSISVSASKFAPDVASAHKDNLNAVED